MKSRRKPCRSREVPRKHRRSARCDFLELRSDVSLCERSDTVVTEVEFDPSSHRSFLRSPFPSAILPASLVTQPRLSAESVSQKRSQKVAPGDPRVRLRLAPRSDAGSLGFSEPDRDFESPDAAFFAQGEVASRAVSESPLVQSNALPERALAAVAPKNPTKR